MWKCSHMVCSGVKESSRHLLHSNDVVGPISTNSSCEPKRSQRQQAVQSKPAHHGGCDVQDLIQVVYENWQLRQAFKMGAQQRKPVLVSMLHYNCKWQASTCIEVTTWCMLAVHFAACAHSYFKLRNEFSSTSTHPHVGMCSALGDLMIVTSRVIVHTASVTFVQSSKICAKRMQQALTASVSALRLIMEKTQLRRRPCTQCQQVPGVHHVSARANPLVQPAAARHLLQATCSINTTELQSTRSLHQSLLCALLVSSSTMLLCLCCALTNAHNHDPASRTRSAHVNHYSQCAISALQGATERQL